MKDLINLNNKRIIIAGVGGIGSQIAQTLDDLNCSLILVDNDRERLEAVAENFQHSSKSVYVCDFSDLTTIETLVSDIVASNGKIDGLVFTVGMSDSRPLKLLKMGALHKLMIINFYSFVELVKCTTKKNRFNEGLSIVGISSVGAYLGNPGQTAYCASKAAMNGAVRSMAKELSFKNIRINTVAPGTVETLMFKEALTNFGNEEGFNNRLERQYMGLCSPEDIANGVVFLLSEMSKKVSGSCLAIDGGKLTS